jgi:hypothetical protein
MTNKKDNGKSNDNGKSEIQGSFPFGFAQGQDDDFKN